MTNKAESTIVGLTLIIIGTLCVFALVVVVSYDLSRIFDIPEPAIIYGSLAGIALGFIITLVNLRRWVAGFYHFQKFITIPMFLFLSAIILCLFMGVPVGNLMLGALAGLYIGRKAFHTQCDFSLFQKRSRNAGIFTALLIGLIAVMMGILAIDEQDTMQAILSLVGLEFLAAKSSGRIVIVALAVPSLVALQYWLTHWMATLGFRDGGVKG